MRYAIPSCLMATPALAHSGAHLHPHDGGTWILAVIGLALAGGVVWAARARK